MKEYKNNLMDTVDMMGSDDYKERFIAEYHQVKIRYENMRCVGEAKE